MEAADGLIFITPVFAMNVSGQLKTLFDRTTYMLHKPTLYSKHPFVIVSTDIAGIKPITMYMKYMMNAFGMTTSGAIGIKTKHYHTSESYRQKLSKNIEAEAKKYKDALAQGSHYQPNTPQVVRFNAWKIKHLHAQKEYPGDYAYWEQKGWLDAAYYYPVKLTLVQKVAVRIVKARLRKILSRAQ